MSVSEIQSKINQIQSQIRAVENQIRQLEGELNALFNSANSANVSLLNTCNNLNTSMNSNFNSLNYSQSQLQRTFNVQLQLKEMYFIFKDVETANKKIRALTNQLYFDYKNQSTVRKIVRGFMDNIDLDMVSDRIIYKAIEREYLQAPDYWLAYCLLAIMFWKENNKEKAEQCLSEAVKLDKKSTDVFFMLFNLKIGRIESALMWFQNFQELQKVGSDNSVFLMLLSTINTRINEDNSGNLVFKSISDYLLQQVDKDGEKADKEQIITLILNYFTNLDQVEQLKYKYIRQYIKENQAMANVLSRAKNNNEILEFIEDLNKVHMNERNLYLNKFMDQLISIPSKAEQKIMDEIDLNEEIILSMEPLKKADENAIMNSQAFKKMAQENHERKVKHNESELNLVNEIVDWVYTKKNNEVNSLTQWNLFALTKDYTVEAYNRYIRGYQNAYIKNYTISINDYVSNCTFKDLNSELQKKNKFCEDKKARLLSMVKDGGAVAMIIISIILLIAGVVGGLVIDQTILMVLGGIIFLILGGIGFVKKAITNPKKRRSINELVRKDNEKLDNIIRKLFEEMNQYSCEYDDADNLSGDIKDKLERI